MDVCVVVPVNDEEVFEKNLLRSPAIATGLTVQVMRGYKSASSAYNDALDNTGSDLIAFVHQDVYLPSNWTDRLSDAVEKLNLSNPNWAVLGVYGVQSDGSYVGHVWCGAGHCVLGEEFSTPLPVASVDELVIVLKRSSGLRFDKDHPGFHLYGTDIVQAALKAGFEAFVIDAPVVHNTIRPISLWGGYQRAYKYTARKWKDHLPIPTTVTPVTRWGLELMWQELRLRKAAIFGNNSRNRIEGPDPVEIAREFGFDRP